MLKRILPLTLLIMATAPAEEAPETKALASALDWLKRHQSPDGRWSTKGFDACCNETPKCTGPGDAENDIGLTALACLALLDGGDSMPPPPPVEKPKPGKPTPKPPSPPKGKGPKPEPPSSPLGKGLAYLLAQQTREGCIGSDSSHDYLYCHTLATKAFCKALMAGRSDLKAPAQKAVDYLLACQNPPSAGGGWKYQNYNLPGISPEKDGINDVSSTTCAVLTLLSARQAGLKVPDASLASAASYVDSLYEARPPLAVFGYSRRADGTPGRRLMMIQQLPHPTTAMGTLSHLLLADFQKGPGPSSPETPPAKPPQPEELDRWIQELGDPSLKVREAASDSLAKTGRAAKEALEKASSSEDPEVKKRATALLKQLDDPQKPGTPPPAPEPIDVEACMGTLLQNLPIRTESNAYYWFFGTQLIAKQGGEPWKAWRAALMKALLASQEFRGCAQGSWDPASDRWGNSGGRIYTTALGAICLEEALRVPNP